MEDLILAPSTSTPAVICRWDGSSIEMRGESYPENPFAFFSPIIGWLDAALREEGKGMTLDVTLAYLNTSSIRSMIDILEMLEDAHRQGRSIAVHWYYDEENGRAAEMAEEFKEDITFPFQIIPLPIIPLKENA